MADQSTFERICEILREQDGVEGELTPETTLEEAGLDSLAVVEAVMTCETEFDIEIDPDAKPLVNSPRLSTALSPRKTKKTNKS